MRWVGVLLGALLGVLLGWWLWRRAGGIFQRLRGAQQAPRDEELLFLVLGRLAKSGGRVSDTHIQAARGEMRRLRLTPAGQRAAIEAFYRGKAGGEELCDPLRRLRHRPEAARALLRACWRMARAEGRVSSREHELLVLWGQWMGWDAAAVAALDQSAESRRPASGNRAAAYEQALRLLGVGRESEPQVIKRAYRRLLSKHHPDKQAGAGATPLQVREATERTRELHAAYALIRQRRGFR